MANPVWIGTTSGSYTTTTNWIGGAIPTTGDNVYLTAGALNSLTTNLDQSAVTIGTFTQDMGFTATVGDLTAGVRTNLKLHCPIVSLGISAPTGNPAGSGKIYLDFGANATVCTVANTGRQAADAGQTPTHLLGTSLTLNVNGGLVGVGLNVGEVSTLTALNVDGGIVILGAGVTPSSVTAYSGSILSASTITCPAITLYSTANYVFTGAATHTAITAYAGSTVTYNGTGTITAINLGGTLDLSGGTGAVTITNMNRYPGGKILDPNKRLTFTNAWVDIAGAGLKDNRSDFGPGRSYKVT